MNPYFMEYVVRCYHNHCCYNNTNEIPYSRHKIWRTSD